MAKKLLWGCSTVVVLVGVGIAVMLTVNRDKRGMAGTRDESTSLSQDLEKEFGGEPQVELLCVLPIVGVAPCILDNDSVRREVKLTFAGYELPGGVVPEEQARRIAIRSFELSEFVKESETIEVVFEIVAGGTSSSVSRTSTYSFPGDELAAAVAGEAPSGEAGEE